MKRAFAQSLLLVAGFAGLAALAGCEHQPAPHVGAIAFGHVGLGPGGFSYPRAVSVGAGQIVAVVDKSARVQLFEADGVFLRSWNLPEMAAGKPVGVHVGADERVYVADTHYHRVVVYDLEGRELARFGEEGRGPGQFILPTDVARDADGNIYVSEYGGNDRISVFSPDYRFLYAIGEGEVAGKPLQRPNGIDIDARQRLWVADSVNHRVVCFDLHGKVLAAWGTMGRDPGQMRYPYDIACLPGGQILICEFENNRLQWFDEQGRSLRTWGAQGRNVGELWAPWGVAAGPDGRIYVVDALNNRIQILSL